MTTDLTREIDAEATAAGERRRRAKSTGTVVRTISRTPAEQVASAMVETPGDLVGQLKQRWPGLWERVLVSARAAKASPGAHLFELIEKGLGE